MFNLSYIDVAKCNDKNWNNGLEKNVFDVIKFISTFLNSTSADLIMDVFLLTTCMINKTLLVKKTFSV